MARQRRHKSRHRRRGRFGGIYKILSILAVAAAVIVACVVFFRINTVQVTGNSRYTAEEVIQASGIQVGDNLITLPKSRIAASLTSKLPYVESVSIQRLLPDSVLLTVTERVAAASIQSDQGRWLISAQGKLLEAGGSGQVLEINGLSAQEPILGEYLQVTEEDRSALEDVLELLAALEEQGMLSRCTALDTTGAAWMMLEYDIYHVKLPKSGDYRYLMALVQGVLDNEQMPKDEPGTLDLTVEEGAVHFRRDK